MPLCGFCKIIWKDKFEELTKEGCGRVQVHQMTNIIHAYTLECGFHQSNQLNQLSPMSNRDFKINEEIGLEYDPAEDYQSNIYKGRKDPIYFTPQLYENVGKGILVSILDIFDKNPYSRIPLSVYKSTENIRKYLAHDCLKLDRFRKNPIAFKKARKIQESVYEAFFYEFIKKQVFSPNKEISFKDVKWPNQASSNFLYRRMLSESQKTPPPPAKEYSYGSINITSDNAQDVSNQNLSTKDNGSPSINASSNTNLYRFSLDKKDYRFQMKREMPKQRCTFESVSPLRQKKGATVSFQNTSQNDRILERRDIILSPIKRDSRFDFRDIKSLLSEQKATLDEQELIPLLQKGSSEITSVIPSAMHSQVQTPIQKYILGKRSSITESIQVKPHSNMKGSQQIRLNLKNIDQIYRVRSSSGRELFQDEGYLKNNQFFCQIEKLQYNKRASCSIDKQDISHAQMHTPLSAIEKNKINMTSPQHLNFSNISHQNLVEKNANIRGRSPFEQISQIMGMKWADVLDQSFVAATKKKQPKESSYQPKKVQYSLMQRCQPFFVNNKSCVKPYPIQQNTYNQQLSKKRLPFSNSPQRKQQLGMTENEDKYDIPISKDIYKNQSSQYKHHKFPLNVCLPQPSEIENKSESMSNILSVIPQVVSKKVSVSDSIKITSEILVKKQSIEQKYSQSVWSEEKISRYVKNKGSHDFRLPDIKEKEYI